MNAEVLAMLQEERLNVTVQHHLALAYNSLLPIYRLPDEPIATIFEISAPISGDTWDCLRDVANDLWTQEEYMQYVSSASRTCSRFQTVLQYAPRWRASFCTIISSNKDDSSSSWAEVLHLLSRSQQCHLSLRAELDDLNPIAVEVMFGNTLKRHMERCRSFALWSQINL